MALAREFGITSFPQPAGGCLLTDPGYGKRLRDLKKHEGLGNLSAIQLLRTGRHFRLGQIKLIVGRNKTDNETIEHTGRIDVIIMKTVNVPGPSATIPKSASENELQLAASICARFSDHTPSQPVTVEVRLGDDKRNIEALPAEQSTIDSLRI